MSNVSAYPGNEIRGQVMMNYSYRVSVVPIYFAVVLAVMCLLGTRSHAQDFKPVHDGVEHAVVTRALTDNEPVKINLLRLDLSKVRLDVHHAMDRAIGLETTSSIAKRKGAVAAINAGFFRLDTSIFAGDAAGILKVDGNLLSESNGAQIALGIKNNAAKTEVSFGHVATRLTLYMGIDTSYQIAGINRERKANEIIIFSPDFGESTLTNNMGTEFIVTNDTTNRNVGNAANIRSGKGSSYIPSDSFVISVSGEAQKAFRYFFKKLMSLVRWRVAYDSPDKQKAQFFASAEDITNGVPQLIKGGKIDITWEQEKASRSFAENRHPRTAVAKLADGKFLMMTVDGRQPGVSAGMNLQELAEYLFSLGAVDAMNLDGGGSTTMFLNGRVVNQPSDKTGERKVGDVILVTLRPPKKTKRN